MRTFLAVLLVVLPCWWTWADTELTYSTNPEYPPFDWADSDTTFAGASVELLRLVLPPEVKTKAVVVPWKRAQYLASLGKIDLLLSVRITPERLRYLTFTSHRAFPNPIVLFVRKDTGLKFRIWDDLRNFLGGVSAGDSFGGGFDEYWRSQLKVEIADGMVENFRKLDLGRIDWFVTGQFLGQAYLAAHPTAHKIVALKPPISTGDIHFAFSSHSQWLKILPYLNRRLEELDRGGVLEALLERYSGPEAAQAGRFPGE